MEKKRKVFDEFDEHKHIIDLGKIDELEEDVLFAIDVKTYKQELDKAREDGYKKGYIDGQIEKINKPKPVVSEFDKTSYLN